MKATRKYLETLGLVEDVRFEKLGPEKCVLHINKCIYAKLIHAALKPKDSICRYAIAAMAIFEKFTGKKVKVTNSEFLQEGTKTIIESREL